jgi:hypothetical protein
VINAIKYGAIDAEEIYSIDGLMELLAHLGPGTIQAIAELVRKRQEYLTALIESLDPTTVQTIARISSQRLEKDRIICSETGTE